MNLKVDSDVKIKYPGLRISILEASVNDELKFNQELFELKNKLEESIKEGYNNPEELERVKEYNLFYKKYGSKVPMEFQIKSIMGDKKIPTINPILTCMFMAELKNVILTAGHDLDKLGDEIDVLLASGTEKYEKINGKIQNLKNDDIYSMDKRGIISSVLSGPDSRTKITDKTKNCLFMCYTFGLEEEEIRSHLNDILFYLKTISTEIESKGIIVL